ncbi:MAG: XshC-Cox1 family protein, partial [Deltaproteobacteria bacterium]
MREVLERLQQWTARGSKAALCTLIEARGTSPRPVGAWMAVCETGEVAGSITGGCVENDAIERALRVLGGGVAETATYGIADELGVEVGLTCGGSVDALIEPFADGPLWRRLAQLLEAGDAGAVAVAVEPEQLRGRRLLVSAGGEVIGSIDPEIDSQVIAEARRRMEAATAGVFEPSSGGRVFVQGFVRPQRLVIVGASHPAVALTRLASTLGFRVTVIDPRSALLGRERLPDADELVCAWPEDALARIELGPDSYVVALAHDPKFDTPAIAHG